MKIERGGRVFPESDKAHDVLMVLLQWLQINRVQIIHDTRVNKLLLKKGEVRGVVSQDKKYTSDVVILATGGASYPLTGSTGDGYRLAELAGHRIVPIRPSLVPLETTNYLSIIYSDNLTINDNGLNLYAICKMGGNQTIRLKIVK